MVLSFIDLTNENYLVACVPLCFIYPPLLHLKACARSTYVKAADIAMLIFGVLLVVFTTTLTIASILAEA